MACVAGTNQLQKNIQSGDRVSNKRPTATPSKPRPILLSTTGEADESKQVEKRSDKQQRCNFCDKKGHFTSRCLALKRLSNHERWKWAEKNKVCFKCLNKGHNKSTCWGRNCNIEGCNKEHNRLLHYSKSTRNDDKNGKVEGYAVTNDQSAKDESVTQEKQAS